MPIFEYKCAKCGRISDFFELRNIKQPKVCPGCGSRELVKQISMFALGVREGDSKRCEACNDRSCPHSES